MSNKSNILKHNTIFHKYGKHTHRNLEDRAGAPYMKEVLEEEIAKGGEAMKHILDFPQVQIKV